MATIFRGLAGPLGSGPTGRDEIPAPMPTGAPFRMARYTFFLDSFHIFNTRAVNDDTDTVAFSLKVGDEPVQVRTKAMGDVDNGAHAVGLRLGPFVVRDPKNKIIMSYQIVNSGANATDTARILTETAARLVEMLGLGGPWGAAAAQLLRFLAPIILANCDGPVAVERYEWDGGGLNSTFAAIRQNSLTQTIFYRGTESPTGCGSNSEYSVTSRVERVVLPITAITRVLYINKRTPGGEASTNADPAEIVREQFLIRWSDEDAENIVGAPLVLHRNAAGQFHIDGAPYNRLNIEFHFTWPVDLRASDPRIELQAGTLRVPELAKSVATVLGSGTAKAVISIRPEQAEPGGVLVFSASFEAGRGGLITQHQITLSRMLEFTGNTLIIPPVR